MTYDTWKLDDGTDPAFDRVWQACDDASLRLDQAFAASKLDGLCLISPELIDGRWVGDGEATVAITVRDAKTSDEIVGQVREALKRVVAKLEATTPQESVA